MKTHDKDPHILEVENLRTRFRVEGGAIYAVNGVSFRLKKGELLGIVGESGSGKSVTVKSLLGLIPMPPGEISSGRAQFGDLQLIGAEREDIRGILGNRIGFVFQDPMTSLNPVLTVGRQITESMVTHLPINLKEAREKAVRLLEATGIPDAASKLKDYPHQFSGGMRQRVMIAIALACDPEILIADEPTTALDVTIQAQIIELVKSLRRKYNMSIVWITHDLGVMAGVADRVMVMYGGCIVERSNVNDLYSNPKHPYTIGLLKSIPDLEGSEHDELSSIAGQAPVLRHHPTSCPFYPRCEFAFGRCTEANPSLTNVGDLHEVACWLNEGKGV